MTYETSTSFQIPELYYTAIFEALAGGNILVRNDAPRFTILASSPSYLQQTGYTKETLIGKGMFEAFPTSNNPTDTGMSDVQASLHYVILNKEPHQLPVQRYDIAGEDGSFSEKYWRASNNPLFSPDGEVAYIIHSAEDITEAVKAKQREAQIVGIEKAYHLFMQVPAIISITKGPDHVLELVNDGAKKLWGKGDDILGKPLADAIPEVQGQGIIERFDQVVETGQPYVAIEIPVSTYRTNTKEDLFFDVVYQPYYERNSNVPAGVFAMSHEVTELVTARRRIDESKEALHQSEQDLRTMVLQAPIGICVVDALTLVSEIANDKFLEIAGRPLKEIVGWMYWDTFREARPYYEEALNRVVNEGITFTASEVEVHLIRHGKKETVHVTFMYEPLKSTEGKVKKVAVWVLDNTPQVTARKKVEESEERFRSMADASPVMIWTLDEAGNSSYYNSRATEFTGDEEAQLKAGKTWQLAIHPDDIETAAGVVSNAVSNRIPYEMECRMQRADGAWRWLLNNGIPRSGKAGEYFGFVGSSIDITEHKTSQQKLQTALEQVRLSKEAAELGTFDMNMQTNDMHWDERCRLLFGISHQDTVSYENDFIKRLHPDDLERVLNVLSRTFDKFLSNGDYDVEYRTIGAEDGLVRWVRAKGKVYFDEQAKPVRFIGSVLDITEKVNAIQQIEALVEERTKELAQANEALQRINKELQRSNQNLEEFAHAASHDLKEPVRKIHFFSNKLKEQLSSHVTESEAQSFGRIENATQRMGNLIDDLLLYSHVSHRPQETEPVDLNEKVQRVLEDLDLEIEEKDATISAGKLPVVQGYRRQLQQLFQNLISNALKYSKADVLPVIEIWAEEVKRTGNRYHLISIKDNGIGFAQEYAEKIFQMFARLHGRAEYSGTGVGLSIVKKVVENHNGFIEVESVIDKGSVFKIYLPVPN